MGRRPKNWVGFNAKIDQEAFDLITKAAERLGVSKTRVVEELVYQHSKRIRVSGTRRRRAS